MNGFKTAIYGLCIMALSIFSNQEMQAFFAEHLPWIGGVAGFIVIALRAITSSAIFAGKPKVLPVLLAGALVLPLLGGCSIAKQADTPLKKWAVAQEAHTAASDSLIGVIQTGQIDKVTAVRIDGWLDRAQDVLNAAITFIQAGEDASALTAIIEATSIIDSIMKEIESVTARNSSVIPWPHVSWVGLGRNGRIYHRNVRGVEWARPDTRGSPRDPSPSWSFRTAA